MENALVLWPSDIQTYSVYSFYETVWHLTPSKTVVAEDNILCMLLGTGFILGDAGKPAPSSMFSVGFNDIEK